MALSTFGRLVRTGLKRALYTQMTLREAVLVARGKSKPLIRFVVEDSPPSTYYNYRIPDDRVSALEQHLQLPAGFPLAKVQTVDDEEPYYCLTLNTYRVSGITNGVRSEWSVYVDTGDGVPRYMVVEARQDGTSMDPVDIITRASRVEHSVAGDRMRTFVESKRGQGFRAECALPGKDATRIPAARAWVEANDLIYWRNGVSDRTYYGAGLANGRMWKLSSDTYSVKNDTEWTPFVEPEVREVLVFTDPLEFIISPWWNL